MFTYIGCGPLTLTVTTKVTTFLVGNPYKPSFTTVTVRGPHPIYLMQRGPWKHSFLFLFQVGRICMNMHGNSKGWLSKGVPLDSHESKDTKYLKWILTYNVANGNR